MIHLKIVAPVLASLAMAPIAANAEHMWENPSDWAHGAMVYDHKSQPLFSANELSLDLGGSYIAGERGLTKVFNTNITGGGGEWGGNVGANYFFTRQFGVGGDVNMSSNGGNLVDTALGNLIFRFPIGDSGFAPYLLGGGGRTTDRSWEWVGLAGLGVEFRFNHSVGIFADGRYLWAQHSADALLLRSGIRLVF